MHPELRAGYIVWVNGVDDSMRYFNQKVEKEFPFDDYDPEGAGDPVEEFRCVRCKDRPLDRFISTMWTPGTSWFLRFPYSQYSICNYDFDIDLCKFVQVQLIYVWIREANEDCNKDFEPYRVLVEACPEYFRGYGHTEGWCDVGVDLNPRNDLFHAWWSKLYTASYADIIDEYYEGVGYADQNPWVFDRGHRGYQKWWWIPDNWDRFPPPDHTPADNLVGEGVIYRDKYRLDVTDNGCHAEWVYQETTVLGLQDDEGELPDCWNTAVGFDEMSPIDRYDDAIRTAYGCWEPGEWPLCSSIPMDCYDPEECGLVDCLAFSTRTRADWMHDGENWTELYAKLYICQPDEPVEIKNQVCRIVDGEPRLFLTRWSEANTGVVHDCDHTEPELEITENYWQKTATYFADITTDPCVLSWELVSETCAQKQNEITDCSITYRDVAGVYHADVEYPTVSVWHNSCVGPFPECGDLETENCEPVVEAFTVAEWRRPAYGTSYEMIAAHLVIGRNETRDVSPESCQDGYAHVIVREESVVAHEHICDSTEPDVPEFETKYLACVQKFTLRRETDYIGWDDGQPPQIVLTDDPNEYAYINTEGQCEVKYSVEETEVDECGDDPTKECENYTGSKCEFQAYTHIILRMENIDDGWIEDTKEILLGFHPGSESIACNPSNPDTILAEKYFESTLSDEHFLQSWSPSVPTETVNAYKVSLFERVWDGQCHVYMEYKENYEYGGKTYPYCILGSNPNGVSYGEMLDESFGVIYTSTQQITKPICLPLTQAECDSLITITWATELPFQAYTYAVWERELSEDSYGDPVEEYLVLGNSGTGEWVYTIECIDGYIERVTGIGPVEGYPDQTCSSVAPEVSGDEVYVGCSKQFMRIANGCTAYWEETNNDPPSKVISATDNPSETIQPDGTLIKTWGFTRVVTGVCGVPDPDCLEDSVPYPTTEFSAYTTAIWEWRINEEGWAPVSIELNLGSNIDEAPVIECTTCDDVRCLRQIRSSLSTESAEFSSCHSISPSDPPMNTYHIARKQRYIGVYSDCEYFFELESDECINYGQQYDGGITSSYIPSSGSANQTGVFQELTGSTEEFTAPSCFPVAELEYTCDHSVMPSLEVFGMYTKSNWIRVGENPYENTSIDLFFGTLSGDEEPVRGCSGEDETVEVLIGYSLGDRHICDYTPPDVPEGSTSYVGCLTRFWYVPSYTAYHGQVFTTGRSWGAVLETTKYRTNDPWEGSYVTATGECRVAWGVVEMEVTNICAVLDDIDCTGAIPSAECEYYMFTRSTWRRLRCSSQFELWDMELIFGFNETRREYNRRGDGDYVYVSVDEVSVYDSTHYVSSTAPSPEYEYVQTYIQQRITTSIEKISSPSYIKSCTVCRYDLGFLYSNYELGGQGTVIDNGSTAIIYPAQCTRTTLTETAWTTDPLWGTVISQSVERILWGCSGVIQLISSSTSTDTYDCSTASRTCRSDTPGLSCHLI